MEIRIRFPGKMTDDPRTTVTLREPGTPWPISFHFITLVDDTDGSTERVHVGFEVGERPYSEPGSTHTPVEADPEPLDPFTVQRIVTNYSLYLNIALHAIEVREGGVPAAIAVLRGKGRTRRGLSDDFYRLIAAEYEQRRQAGGYPQKEIAAAHHADPATVSRWIKEARRRGLITEEGSA